VAIRIREALLIAQDTTRPFDIKFASFDANRGKASEIIELENVVQVGASHHRKKNGTIVVMRTDRKEHPYTIHIPLIIEVNKQRIAI
jgi:hypothetical protein